MNTRLDEFLMEERRKDIQHDMQQLRLEQTALSTRIFHRSIFTRTMENLGKWLIAHGELLVKRYETPVEKCRHAGRGSYAH